MLLEVLVEQLYGDIGVLVLRLLLEQVYALVNPAHASLAKHAEQLEAVLQHVARARGGAGIGPFPAAVGLPPLHVGGSRRRVHGSVHFRGRLVLPDHGRGLLRGLGCSPGRRLSAVIGMVPGLDHDQRIYVGTKQIMKFPAYVLLLKGLPHLPQHRLRQRRPAAYELAYLLPQHVRLQPPLAQGL